MLLEKRSQPNISGSKKKLTASRAEVGLSNAPWGPGSPPRMADPPDEKLPALYGKLASADAMNDPEAVVSWHLAAGRAEEGWPDMFLSSWRDGGVAL